jgi:pseudouridine-5'-phosphate glycosidase
MPNDPRQAASGEDAEGRTMTTTLRLEVRPEVEAALRRRQPVVALESTLIAHGLPWPLNLDTARAAEAAVRDEGAVPATIAVLQGQPTVGLADDDLERLARARGVRKASTRDLAAAVVQGATAATTVAATMVLADRAGIRVFATGGIGGVHRCTGSNGAWDVSADLDELARTPVAVVCAGAKSILDLAATLEVLETRGVPVVGYRTSEFPAFYLASSGLPVSARTETPLESAALAAAHWAVRRSGVVVAQSLPAELALDPNAFEAALVQAERDAADTKVRGASLTPFLLTRLAALTEGRTLRANQALIVANARLAAQIARAFPGDE